MGIHYKPYFLGLHRRPRLLWYLFFFFRSFFPLFFVSPISFFACLLTSCFIQSFIHSMNVYIHIWICIYMYMCACACVCVYQGRKSRPWTEIEREAFYWRPTTITNSVFMPIRLLKGVSISLSLSLYTHTRMHTYAHAHTYTHPGPSTQCWHGSHVIMKGEVRTTCVIAVSLSSVSGKIG